MILFLSMTKFEIWSLVFAGITATGVILTIFGAAIKFFIKRNHKVIASYEITKLTKTEEFAFITANLDIINQTEHPTSILEIDLVFENFSVYATHIEHIIPNLLDTFKTKNIILAPFESVGINFAEFKCPINDFQENAKLRIVTTQRNYTYPIFCRKREESSE